MTNPTATKRKTETQSKISWTAINVADKQRQTTTATKGQQTYQHQRQILSRSKVAAVEANKQ